MATPKNRTAKDNADHAPDVAVTVALDETAPGPLDFATLVVEDVAPEDVPANTRNRESKYNADHPVVKWLAESYANDSASKSVTVPNGAVKAMVTTLRGAAAAAKVGVKLATVELSNGTTRVVFSAREKRSYTRKAQSQD